MPLPHHSQQQQQHKQSLELVGGQLEYGEKVGHVTSFPGFTFVLRPGLSTRVKPGNESEYEGKAWE